MLLLFFQLFNLALESALVLFICIKGSLPRSPCHR